MPHMTTAMHAALDDVETWKRRLVNHTRTMDDAPLHELIARFAEIRDLQARLKAISTGMNSLAESLSLDLIPASMTRAGYSTVHHEVGRVSLRTRTSATMLDREQAFAWLRANGKADLIIETVSSQTLAATARELIEAGDELPDNIFKLHVKTYTSITRLGALKSKDDDDGTES